MRQRSKTGGFLIGIALTVGLLVTGEFYTAGALFLASLWYVTGTS